MSAHGEVCDDSTSFEDEQMFGSLLWGPYSNISDSRNVSSPSVQLVEIVPTTSSLPVPSHMKVVDMSRKQVPAERESQSKLLKKKPSRKRKLSSSSAGDPEYQLIDIQKKILEQLQKLTDIQAARLHLEQSKANIARSEMMCDD